MTTTVIIALLPIVVTLMLGYFAGWHHDVDKDQAGVLNRMVMSYALPLVLFSGIVTTPFSRVTDNAALFLWIAIGMIGGFAIVIVVCRYVLHDDLGVAALRALAIAGRRCRSSASRSSARSTPTRPTSPSPPAASS